MDKIFSYGKSRRDNNVMLFTSRKAENHEQLRKDICSNAVSGYIIDKGTCVAVAKHAADEIARHLIRCGWSLGV